MFNIGIIARANLNRLIIANSVKVESSSQTASLNSSAVATIEQIMTEMIYAMYIILPSWLGCPLWSEVPQGT